MRFSIIKNLIVKKKKLSTLVIFFKNQIFIKIIYITKIDMINLLKFIYNFLKKYMGIFVNKNG